MRIPENLSSQEKVNLLISFYHSVLKKEEIALDYLYCRGITSRDIIDKFQLGYSYSDIGWRYSDRFLYLKKDSRIKSMFFHKKNNKYLDILSNRIVIPIVYNGDVKFVTSRSIYNDCPKPHLHIGKTVKYAFNHRVLEENSDYVIIVESPLDAIQLEQKNLNAIAVMGTNMVPSLLINSLKKYINKNIYICFDIDKNKAGINGAIKLSMLLNSHQIKSKIILLPKPNSGDKNDISLYFKKYSKSDFLNLMKNNLLTINSSVDLGLKHKVRTSFAPKSKRIRLCPFHDDKTPSLVIYDDTESFYCFGCHKYGTIKFLENYLKNNNKKD